MIGWIVALSARARASVFLLTLVAVFAGWRSLTDLGLDALPDLGDRQIVIRATWARNPELVDAQITSPLVSALQSVPGVRAVRGQSDFGSSFVFIVFDEDQNQELSRTRVLEALAAARSRLPAEAELELSTDGSSLGWIFQYVLTDPSGQHSLADLRSYQDWYLDLYLSSVPGVAEVAPVGGFVKEYQVRVDPHRLVGYGLAIRQVVDALREEGRDVDGRVIEAGGSELIVRGRGAARSVEDLGAALVKRQDDGTPVLVRDVAQVVLGSEFRRGVTDLNGTGEVVSGIVIARPGQNALDVARRVRLRIDELRPSLPTGLRISAVYDRSDLVQRSVDTAIATAVEVAFTVAIVILVFLWHPPSAAVSIVTIPVAILIAFVPLRWLEIDLNIMSLGGIAMAIGALVDAGIVVAEQVHRRLEDHESVGGNDRPKIVLAAIQEVVRPGFLALTIIAVSFVPVLALQGEEGRLFAPLVYAKSGAVLAAALVLVTLDPALRMWFSHRRTLNFRPVWLCHLVNALCVGRVLPERRNPLNRFAVDRYASVVSWALEHPRTVIGITLLLGASAIPAWTRLGTESMPPFDEGTLLYMPTTAPGISTAEAQRLLQVADAEIARFPEVASVLGKAGRAETATDPAPLSMFETLVALKPRHQWRSRHTWYSAWAPDWLASALRRVTSDRIGVEELVRELDQAVRVPGIVNAWTMPIRGRVDMLATGLRTPLGLKISGKEPAHLQEIAERVAAILRMLPETRSAVADQPGLGTFLDVEWDRAALARQGLTIGDAQAVVEFGIGGADVSAIVDGRERYSVSVRYLEDFRSDADALRRVPLVTPDGQGRVPLGEVATVRTARGPLMIRNESGLPTSYVYTDVAGTDFGTYVSRANSLLRQSLTLPSGYSITWSGQYESIVRTRTRLMGIMPIVLLVIVVLLYTSTGAAWKTGLVLLAVPFSLIGAVWLLVALDYQVSAAVWVGLVALMGVDAETGVFMLLYLEQAYARVVADGRVRDDRSVRQAVIDGAARRLRPKLMTVTALVAGLGPLMWTDGAGSEVMKRVAAPMLGGIVSSFALELVVYPVLFYAWKRRRTSSGVATNCESRRTPTQSL